MQFSEKRANAIVRELLMLHRHGLLRLSKPIKTESALWNQLQYKDPQGKWAISSLLIDIDWLELQIGKEQFALYGKQNPLLTYLGEALTNPEITPNPLVDGKYLCSILPSQTIHMRQTLLYRYLNATHDFQLHHGPSLWFQPDVYLKHIQLPQSSVCPFAHYIRYGLRADKPCTYLFDPTLWRSRRIGKIEGPAIYDYLVSLHYFREIRPCRPKSPGSLSIDCVNGSIQGFATVIKVDSELEVYTFINRLYTGRVTIESRNPISNKTSILERIGFVYYINPGLWRELRTRFSEIRVELIISDSSSIAFAEGRDEYVLSEEEISSLDHWHARSEDRMNRLLQEPAISITESGEIWELVRKKDAIDARLEYMSNTLLARFSYKA